MTTWPVEEVLDDDAPLEVKSVRRDPRKLRLLDVNARYMRAETFNRLVENIRRDGACTQSVLLYKDSPDCPDGEELVLSGNHRTQAAIEAGVFDVPAELVDQPISRQRQIQLQLSHNAISGEDDPATLKQLYEELADVDLREASGLDDATLGLLAKVDLAAFSEANLDFQTVTIVFLPHERERAEAALEDARKAIRPDFTWLAALEQHEPTLDALQTAHAAWKVGNVATALGQILNTFEAHLADEPREAWYDTETGEAKRDGAVPLESVFGTRVMPAAAAAVVLQAMQVAVQRGDLETGQVWRFLELVAADYIAGA